MADFREYSAAFQDHQNDLAHYGVKGMKWKHHVRNAALRAEGIAWKNRPERGQYRNGYHSLDSGNPRETGSNTSRDRYHSYGSGNPRRGKYEKPERGKYNDHTLASGNPRRGRYENRKTVDISIKTPTINTKSIASEVKKQKEINEIKRTSNRSRANSSVEKFNRMNSSQKVGKLVENMNKRGTAFNSALTKAGSAAGNAAKKSSDYTRKKKRYWGHK